MNLPPLPFDAATVWLAAAVCIAIGLVRSRTGNARARHAGLALGAVGAALAGWAIAAPPRSPHAATASAPASAPKRVLQMDTLYAAAPPPPEPEPEPAPELPIPAAAENPAVGDWAAESPPRVAPARTAPTIAPRAIRARPEAASTPRERTVASRAAHPARPAPRRVVLATPRPRRAAPPPPASFRPPVAPRRPATGGSVAQRQPAASPPVSALQRVTDDLGIARFHKDRGEYSKTTDLLAGVDRQIAGLERDYPGSPAAARLRRQASALESENRAACQAEAKVLAGTARAISCF